jgi:hypothetical protein
MSRLTRDKSTPRDAPERGSTLIWALLFVIVTAGAIVAHTIFMSAQRQERSVRLSREAMASTFARSGLADTLGWFRRQVQQPVARFAPVCEPDRDPPIVDTIDPALGLVRSFEIRGNLWGRYEVRQEDARDVSRERDAEKPGSVWDIGVRSYVYRVVDPDVPFDRPPNRVVSTVIERTEIRGIPVRPPAMAAVCAEDPASVKLNTGASVDGGLGAGIAGKPLHNALSLLSQAISGAPAVAGLAGYDQSPVSVFSMGLEELRSLADEVWQEEPPASVTELDGQVIYARDGLDLATPITADNVLLVVDGNLHVKRGNNAAVRGLVYVTGDAHIEGPFRLEGSLVVGGKLRLGGSTETVLVRFDAAVVERMRQEAAKYRLRRQHIVPD